jgi:sulfate transport system substrate-binding protein
VSRLYRNVPVLDSGARGSTTTFAQRGLGDVLLTWESEAHLLLKAFGEAKFDVVVPSTSILAEPPVAVVESNTAKHGTTEVARAYLAYLYSDEGQETAARNHYRPRSTAVAAKYARQFPSIRLFTVDEKFGGWQKAQKKHFADNGTFDQLYGARK